MNEQGPFHGPAHEERGEGCTLYCPRVFGIACESCTCKEPCKDAYDAVVVVEWYRRPVMDRNTCRVCGSRKLELRNHSLIWHDGDVYCENGHFVRLWDAG